MRIFKILVVVSDTQHCIASKNTLEAVKHIASPATRWKEIRPDFLVGYVYDLETYHIKIIET